MKIIYPALVEQAYKFITNQGIKTTKAEVYKMQVADGMLKQNGEPTQKAIDEGLVSEFKQTHATLKQFKKEYPIFKKYGKNEFTQQEGIWYVSQNVIKDVHKKIKAKSPDFDELQQLDVYFNYRNYDNPYGSIAEVKGIFHPLYTPYDDSMFKFVDGLVAIPKTIMADILHRCETGELEVDEATLDEFRQILNRMEE
jgi:hypothetical protein